MPMGQYKDWDACKADGKSDAYCGFLKAHAEVCVKCDSKEIINIPSKNMTVCKGCENVQVFSGEANESTFTSFVDKQISILKKKSGKEVEFLYSAQPQTEGMKVKGTLAYAGVSLNNRLYLPETLARGDGVTVPLLLNHSSTAGAEAELDTLPENYRTGLMNSQDMKVGEVTLSWDPNKLTLSYEGYVVDPFFIKEIQEGKMAVSLGVFYDGSSPQVCDRECYTVIKGAEFKEVSLVYHPGFPIATIQAAESLLKQKATESMKANEEMNRKEGIIMGKWNSLSSSEQDKILPARSSDAYSKLDEDEKNTVRSRLGGEEAIAKETEEDEVHCPLCSHDLVVGKGREKHERLQTHLVNNHGGKMPTTYEAEAKCGVCGKTKSDHNNENHHFVDEDKDFTPKGGWKDDAKEDISGPPANTTPQANIVCAQCGSDKGCNCDAGHVNKTEEKMGDSIDICPQCHEEFNSHNELSRHIEDTGHKTNTKESRKNIVYEYWVKNPKGSWNGLGEFLSKQGFSKETVDFVLRSYTKK